MRLMYLEIDKIKNYENNPRVISEEAIDIVARSINLFGFNVPILIDDNNEIIAGHTRLEASKRMNIKEIPCLMINHLSEKQIKAYRIADNKLAEKSEWDQDKLEIEMKNIEDMMLGFDFNEEEEIEEPKFLHYYAFHFDSDRLEEIKDILNKTRNQFKDKIEKEGNPKSNSMIFLVGMVEDDSSKSDS